MRAQPNRRVVRLWTSAAALAAAGVAVAQQPPPAGGGGVTPSPQFNPPGSEMARATGNYPPGPLANSPITPSTPAVKAVQDLLARAVTDATTPGRTADLTGLLARQDRDRAAAAPANWADVEQAGAAFQAAWQARFGLSFKVEDKVSLVFTAPLMDVGGLTPTTGPATGPAGGDAEHPTVTLADPGGHSRTTLRLTHTPGAGDAGGWKFDVGDAVTAATIHDSLLRHLTAVTANQSRWPTDVDQAYVYVTHHILSALGEAADVRH